MMFILILMPIQISCVRILYFTIHLPGIRQQHAAADPGFADAADLEVVLVHHHLGLGLLQHARKPLRLLRRRQRGQERTPPLHTRQEARVSYRTSA